MIKPLPKIFCRLFLKNQTVKMKELVKAYLPFIITLICFFCYLNKCQKNNFVNNITVKKDSTVVYLYDTNKRISKTYNVYSNPIFTVNPTQKVDTQAIINKYFTKYYLTDTLKDTLINLVVNDTLFNNKITFRQYSYKLVKPYQQIITIKEQTSVLNNGFYLGAFASVNKQINGFGVLANYNYNKNLFGAGFDFLNKNIQLQYAYKVGKK